MSHGTMSFVALCIGLLVFLLVVSFVSKNYSLNRIKSKTVGDGQHGTARWATLKEIGKTYAHIPFDVVHWRKGERLPQKQGVVVGSMGGGKKEQRRIAVLGRTAVRYVKRIWKKRKNGQYTDEPELIRALVDSDDIHCLMIGASGVGKTAYFLYPNLEYTCASGMSFLALDSKGDLARNYGAVASKYQFIEVMGCPGGCIAGGGQPFVKPCFLPDEDIDILDTYKEKRANALYSEDERQTVRQSHNNTQVQQLYRDFLGEPNSHKAHELLHTHYAARVGFNDVKKK